MSITHKVVAGETFDTISRISFGTEIYEQLISDANPGVKEPLTAGTIVVIPKLESAPKNLTQQLIAPKNELSLIIDGKIFSFWQSVRLTSFIDSISKVIIFAPYDKENKELVETFKPYSYQSVEVFIGSDVFFSGVIINQPTAINADTNTITVEAYAVPGVLLDCSASPESYNDGSGALEFNDQTVLEIAQSLCLPFGINVASTADVGPTFDRVSIAASSTVFSFLVELCKQRNLVISNTADGSLLMQQPALPGAPVAALTEDNPPVFSVTTSKFDGREYFSHITGIEPIIPGLFGLQHTVTNTLIGGVFRPYTFLVTDADGGDIITAVEAKAGRMFANVARYFVSVATWNDANGVVWQPNTTLTLFAPGAQVVSRYEFLIRTVELQNNDNTITAVLELLVPGALSGKMPESLPWDG